MALWTTIDYGAASGRLKIAFFLTENLSNKSSKTLLCVVPICTCSYANVLVYLATRLFYTYIKTTFRLPEASKLLCLRRYGISCGTLNVFVCKGNRLFYTYIKTTFRLPEASP